MFNNRTLWKVISLLSCVLSTGCLFHTYNNPRIEGVITDQGTPLAGIPVFLRNARETVKTTVSDTKGHFFFDGQGEWNVFIPIGPQDRITRWAIGFALPRETVSGYKGGRFGGPLSGYTGSDHISLACDTARKGIQVENGEPDQICRLLSED